MWNLILVLYEWEIPRFWNSYEYFTFGYFFAHETYKKKIHMIPNYQLSRIDGCHKIVSDVTYNFVTTFYSWLFWIIWFFYFSCAQNKAKVKYSYDFQKLVNFDSYELVILFHVTWLVISFQLVSMSYEIIDVFHPLACLQHQEMSQH